MSMIRNTIGAAIGFVLGSIVNMVFVSVGPTLIPLPEGADVSNLESLREAMSSFTPANFLFPFLAHALGTLVGAFVAALICGSHKMLFALSIGVLFLAGGITMVALCGGPMWFILADLIVAYLPMAWLGGWLAMRMTGGGQRGATTQHG